MLPISMVTNQQQSWLIIPKLAGLRRLIPFPPNCKHVRESRTEIKPSGISKKKTILQRQTFFLTRLSHAGNFRPRTPFPLCVRAVCVSMCLDFFHLFVCKNVLRYICDNVWHHCSYSVSWASYSVSLESKEQTGPCVD